MLHKISTRITSFFIDRHSISSDDREIYEYSFEILISTLMNLLCLIIIGFSTQRYIESIVFIFVFMSMREFGGGYHAKTHTGCVLTILLCFGVFIGLTYLPNIVLECASIPLFVISIMFSLILAPVGCENKPIDKDESMGLKKKLTILLLLLSLLWGVMWIFEVTRKYAFSISYTMFSVSLLYVAGAIKK